MHPFKFSRAVDTDAAWQNLARGQEQTKLVAGGTNLVDLMKTGVEAPARLVLGGVAHKPWRGQEAEAVLVGEKPGVVVFKEAADAALKGARGYRYNAFKIELAKRSIVRALSEVCAA